MPAMRSGGSNGRKAPRWASWTLLAVLAAACGQRKDPPPPSRVVAVQSKPVDAQAMAAFCDALPAGAQGKPFASPALAEGSLTLRSGPTWINLWATWCKPCLEEIPRLLGWQKRLQQEGIPLQLHFVSVDASAEDVQRYRAAHPDLPPSARLPDAAALPNWLTALGARDAASVPVQVLLDAQHRVRCIRSGPVGDHDYPVVQRLMR